MELHQLQAFVIVARELSFSRAAHVLHIAQPALSRKIKHLEAELDVELIIRSGNRFAPSEPGNRFLLDAERILLLCTRSVETARRIRDRRKQSLRIGYTTLLHHHIVLSALDRYLYSHPGVAASIIELPTSEQLAAVEDRFVDVGFVLQSACDCESEDLATAAIFHHRKVLALPISSPFAGKQTITPEDLRQLRAIELPNKSFAERNAHPANLYPAALAGAAESNESLQTLMSVEAGLGAAILPEEVTQVHHEGVVFRPTKPTINYVTSLVWRRNETQHAIIAFINYMRSQATNGTARFEHISKKEKSLVPVARMMERSRTKRLQRKEAKMRSPPL
ncbi:MAG TPA: LysR family transcriptional regulator [Nitrospira sp.]|nr:LysR family transcriptional regulator [Nitrospira sp.]